MGLNVFEVRAARTRAKAVCRGDQACLLGVETLGAALSTFAQRRRLPRKHVQKEVRAMEKNCFGFYPDQPRRIKACRKGVAALVREMRRAKPSLEGRR